jgi:hypothetical protein
MLLIQNGYLPELEGNRRNKMNKAVKKLQGSGVNGMGWMEGNKKKTEKIDG